MIAWLLMSHSQCITYIKTFCFEKICACGLFCFASIHVPVCLYNAWNFHLFLFFIIRYLFATSFTLLSFACFYTLIARVVAFTCISCIIIIEGYHFCLLCSSVCAMCICISFICGWRNSKLFSCSWPQSEEAWTLNMYVCMY